MSASTSRLGKGWAMLLAAATAITTLGGVYTFIAFDLRGRDPMMTVGAEQLPEGLYFAFGAATDRPITELEASFAAYDRSGKLLKADYFTPNPMSIAGNRTKETTFGPSEGFADDVAFLRFCGIHAGAYGIDTLQDLWLITAVKGSTVCGQAEQLQTRWVLQSPDCTAPDQLPPETLQMGG